MMTSERSPNIHIGFQAESTFKIKSNQHLFNKKKMNNSENLENQKQNRDQRIFEILKQIHDLQRAKHLLI